MNETENGLSPRHALLRLLFGLSSKTDGYCDCGNNISECQVALVF